MTCDSIVIAKAPTKCGVAHLLCQACHSINLGKTRYWPVQYDALVMVAGQGDRKRRDIYL
jgi:hypothetical protein